MVVREPEDGREGGGGGEVRGMGWGGGGGRGCECMRMCVYIWQRETVHTA